MAVEEPPGTYDAEFVLNHDGGEVQMDHGKTVAIIIDATEKLYSDYQVVVTNPGGHSSLPRPDNAIYELANALVRLQHHQFPFELNSVTRAYYGQLAQVEPGQPLDAVARLVRDAGQKSIYVASDLLAPKGDAK